MQTLGRSGTLVPCNKSQIRSCATTRGHRLKCTTSNKRSGSVAAAATSSGVWPSELDTDSATAERPYVPEIMASRANRISLPQRQKRRDSRRPPPPDLPSILYDQRILVPAVTELIVAEMLHLEKEGPRQPIEILINSTGTTRADGETLALDGEGIAILSTMGFVRTPIETVNIGVAVGWSCVILASGRKGRRKSFPHALAMLQQPRQPPTGQRQAIELHVKWREVLGFKQDLLRALSMATGWNVEKLDKDIQRALYMAPEDCIAYNIIDEVIAPDLDKLMYNELKWRKSGRLEEASRIVGWQREFEAAFRQMGRSDMLEALAEESRDGRDVLMKEMGVDFKTQVEGMVPDYVRAKLAEGKIPLSKGGVEVLKRQSERVRDKVMERRRKTTSYPADVLELRKQRTREAIAPAQEAGLPIHEGQGLDIDYQAMFAELDAMPPSQYTALDIAQFVKKFIRGVKPKPPGFSSPTEGIV